ncbi:MAG: Holliday junction resolvase RuvX [Deltaproteobacteria bacterium]|nr:Holliday junction resolvase RuvX [Deltaproteobacteria bacterium]MBW2308887.1 Holliday junction resolvase RuvX [Deltaproteobacteria bacterium]
MKVIGLDIGTRRIGVAASDDLGLTAHGRKTIQRTGFKSDIRRIEEMVFVEGAERIVVGLPKNMDGSLGPVALEALRFAQTLKKRLGLPVDSWDERFSTMMAEKTLLMADVSRRKRKKVIDKLSAVIILQGYLDRLRHGTN